MLWIVGELSAEWKTYLDDNKYQYGLFTDPRRATTYTGLQHIQPLDFENQETLLHSLRELPSHINVSSVFVAGFEQYVAPAAIIAQHYGVPGLPIESAAAVTNKVLMRKKLYAYDAAITPKYLKIRTVEDALAFGKKYGYPIVMKPTNLMKSLFVTISHSPEELEQNYHGTVSGLASPSTQIITTSSSDILVEEYLEGTMHTVAGFVDSEGILNLLPQITDCITAENIHANDMFLFSRQLPSRLSSQDQAEVLRVAAAGVKALGIQSSPLHIEIMLTKHGAKIIEIGARPGGYRARMYKNAYGIDLFKACLLTAQSQTIDIHATFSAGCAVLEVFPGETTYYSGIRNLDLIKKLKSRAMVDETPRGKKIGRAADGYRAALKITLTSSHTSILDDDIARLTTSFDTLV